MDRKWVFRGWDAVGNKGWVYGDLVHNQKVTVEGLEPRVMVGGYEVVPESVGLFTTVKDIYEGDVVESTDGDGELMRGVVEWHKPIGGFLVKCRKEGVGFAGHYFFSADWKVIGNVYQNSELLKEENHG